MQVSERREDFRREKALGSRPRKEGGATFLHRTRRACCLLPGRRWRGTRSFCSSSARSRFPRPQFALQVFGSGPSADTNDAIATRDRRLAIG